MWGRVQMIQQTMVRCVQYICQVYTWCIHVHTTKTSDENQDSVHLCTTPHGQQSPQGQGMHLKPRQPGENKQGWSQSETIHKIDQSS